MPLFRYFTPERGLQALTNLELVVVPPKYLNDPFEFSPIIKCEDPAGFSRTRLEEITTSPDFFEENRSHFPVGLTFEQFQAALRRTDADGLHQLEREVSEVDQRIQTEAQDIISRFFGVICFSADALNPVMWAHYASSQSGLVIEFDENHRLFSGGSFLKVEYSNEPFTFDASVRGRRDDVESFAKRKSLKWSYELESRLVIELSHLPAPRETADGRRYFLPIDSQIITSVTLGLRVSDRFKAEVIQSLSASNLEHVDLFQIRRNIDLDALERVAKQIFARGMGRRVVASRDNEIASRYARIVDWLKRHFPGIIVGTIGNAVFFLFLAVCSAIHPFLAGIWNQPWKWNVNNVLLLVSIGLFIIALIQLSRAVIASRRPVLTEEERMELLERQKRAEAETMPPKKESIEIYDSFEELTRRGDVMMERFETDDAPTEEQFYQWDNELIALANRGAELSERNKLRSTSFMDLGAQEAMHIAMNVPREKTQLAQTLFSKLKVARAIMERLAKES